MGRPRKSRPVVKYGKQFPEGTSKLEVELWCLRHDKRGDYEGGRLASFDHFRNAVNIIWNNKDSTRRHIWNEWSEKMFKEAIGQREKRRFVGVAGCGSSGKSDAFALYAIVMYLSNPTETMVLLTSLTLETAKGRIWKAVREYWRQLERFFAANGAPPPGSAVHSKCRIRGMDKQGGFTDETGLMLVAADKQKGEDATSKIVGTKAPGRGMLILIADELPGLSHNVLTVAYTNLTVNYEFQMIALGNPSRKLDPFGKFCTPKDGWDSVAHEPDEWETQRGKVIRLNAEHSPRVKEEDDFTEEEIRAGKEPVCFWMPTRADIEGMARDYDITSQYYYTNAKAMWCFDKSPMAIFSETELLAASDSTVPVWDYPDRIVRVSGMDSSYTSGGDKSVDVQVVCGRVEGKPHLHVSEVTTLGMDDSLPISPAHQIARAWMRGCEDAGIAPKNAGFDGSGAGVPFGGIVQAEWSPQVKDIQFGGAPSGRKMGLNDDTGEKYANRVSEIWLQIKPLLREGQVSGLTESIIEDLVSREFSKKPEPRKLKIESKIDLKKRLGRSPDCADAFLIAVDVAIQNGLLDSVEEQTIIRKERTKWKERKMVLPSRFRRRKTRQLKF